MAGQETAYFLVAHGSRQSDCDQSLQKLAQLFEAALIQQGGDPVWVGTGALEFQAESLTEQLLGFCERLACQGLPSREHQVKILPMFLLPGTHVMEDLPQAVQAAQTRLAASGSILVLNLAPYVGSHPKMGQLIRSILAQSSPTEVWSSQHEAWILIGHGSKRPSGNQAIQSLAQQLKMHAVFWVNRPSLEDKIQELKSQGIASIGVVPYFLFSGKITTIITAQVHQLALSLKPLKISVFTPLEPQPELAQLMLDL